MANFDLVRRKGTLISVGNASGAVEAFPPLKLAPKNLKLVRPRYALLSFHRLRSSCSCSMANYITTPEESDHYTKELFDALTSGLFKVRICNVFPFSTEGAQTAQRELTTPGGKLAGKILLKISED